jgi:diacylglycerol kinase (ATP)
MKQKCHYAGVIGSRRSPAMDAVVMTAAPVQTNVPRRILAVFNPAAGRRRRSRFDTVVGALVRLGASVTVVATTHPGHAVMIAREASADDFDVIAAGGGDGTINEIVNGLHGKSIALGIIPLGTANVLADEIGLPRSPDAVARALAFGPLTPIHAGVANGRRFVMMAGAGFDATVAAGVSIPLKKKIGPLAYVVQAAKQAFGPALPGCEVTVDGITHHTASAVICNGSRYGGPFVAARMATVTDDLLHVILLKGGGWWNVLRYGVALLLGRLDKLTDVQIIPARRIDVVGGYQAPVQADGDIITALPAHIMVDPEPILLAFPAR